MAAQYRQRFDHGSLLLDGSITYGDKSDTAVNTGQQTTRGHITGSGRFDLDETYRTGFELARATDATYMRRYGFGGGGSQLGGANAAQELTTTAYVEGFNERDYGKVSGYAFQDLQANAVSGQTPLLLPLAQYNFVGNNDSWGGHTRVDSSVLGLSRDIGADSRRLSVRPSWQLPFTSSAGDVTTFTGVVQADAYNVNDVPVGDNNRTFDGTTGRVFPQMMVDWRYPFARQHERFTEVLEPVAAVVAAPNGNNPAKIPNEDSQLVDFDDLNILQMSRYPGVDRVDSGQRVVYGLRWSGYGQNGASTDAFLGQSYSFQKHPEFGIGSGIANNASDLVGRWRVTPANYLDFLYRFRVDAETGTVRRHDVGLAAGPSSVRFNMDYVFARAQPDTTNVLATPVGNREQVSAGLSIRVTDNWDVRGQTIQDLTSATGGPLYNAGSLIYHDECLTFTTTIFRRYTSDRDLTPATGVFFSFIFKYLGDFESGQRPG
jgi:LPS-assembly protein